MDDADDKGDAPSLTAESPAEDATAPDVTPVPNDDAALAGANGVSGDLQEQDVPAADAQDPEPTPQPTPGTYALRAKTAEDQLLDIKGGAASGKLITYRSNSGINQRFQLAQANDGTWRITSALDGRSLDGSTEAGAQALVTEAAGSWAFEQFDGFWRIRSLASGLVLGIAGEVAQNSMQVQLQEAGEQTLAAQLWELIAAPALDGAQGDVPQQGLYRVVAPTGKVMDVKGGKDKAGTQLIAYTRGAGPNQVFRVEVTEQGYVRLHAGDTNMVVSSGDDLLAGAGAATLRKASDRALDQLFVARKVDGGWELRDLAADRPLGLKSWQVVSGANATWQLQDPGNLLTQGLFEINLLAAKTKRLEVRGASLDAGAHVFQWTRNSAQNQKWDIVRVGKNRYTVQNVRSGLYLSFDEAGNAVQAKDAERFRPAPLVTGWGLVSERTGQALRVSGNSTDDRANACFAEQDGSAAERFALTKTDPLADGTYAIELGSKRSLVVATKGESFVNKVNVQLGSWSGAKTSAAGNQKWLFVRNDDGTYTIINAYSELALDASGATPKSGANVAQWTSKKSDNQKWRLVYNHDGTFDIVNVANKNVVLTAAGASSGKNVNVSKDADKATQHFAFKPTTYKYPAISGDATLDGYIRAMIKKYGTGRDGLWKAYCTIGNNPYIYMNEYPKGSWKSWSIPYAKYMYQTGRGNCYRYASLICWYARGIGYDCRTVSGEIVLGGSWAAHGWVEVYSGGQTLVLDTRLGLYRHRRYGAPLGNSFLVPYARYPYRARVVTYA